MSEARETRLYLRVKPSFRAALNAVAEEAGMSPTDYVRRAVADSIVGITARPARLDMRRPESA